MMNLKSIAAGLVLAIVSLAPAFGQGAGQLGSGQIWANPTANQGRAQPTAATAYFDFVYGNTRGGVLERGASGWHLVAPHATVGMPWVSGGAGADSGYGSLSPSSLPNPTASTLGGVESITQLAHNFVTFIDTSGVPHQAQPAISDLASISADNVVGNFTGSSAAPGQGPLVNCGSALTYSTSSHAFGCNTLAGTGTVTEQKNTAGTGLAISGNCDNTSTNASSPCQYAMTNAMGANKLQVFTTGSGTITTPTGAAWAKFTIVGGGGGGGGGGTTGGGTGGTGGNSCINTSGAACTSPVYQAGGGTGGPGAGTGGAGGGGSVSGSGVCTASWPGENGFPPLSAATTGQSGQSGGGSALFGGGGRGNYQAGGLSGLANTGGGAQGGGQATASSFGGAGGGGGASCIVLVQSPAASYTYAVGAGGTNGTAGTSGNTGGAGGSGIIIAEFGFN